MEDKDKPENGNELLKIRQDLADLDESEVGTILTSEEKRFLLYVERGDVPSVKHILKKYMKENLRKPGTFNINCVDPLGRSALAIAIENENMDMIMLLLNEGIEPSDSLLYAINEEYVEAVEILLAHEEKIHKEGEPYSWQRLEGIRANYTSDITPLILAAHKDNYEILKQLLDRGAALPMPHDVKCGCDECVISNADDSLRHSLSRINSYRALCSPSLICLSSRDPFVTAFALTKELAKLSRIENEFKDEYLRLRSKVVHFAKELIENTRTSLELEIILNYDPEGQPFEKGQSMNLTKLREAVDSKQKEFVAHANIQQLLATVWYEGMPGFKRLAPKKQLVKIVKIGAMFPFYCLALLFAPNTKFGNSMKKPFIKFIVHSTSYLFFLTLLVIVSLHVETFLIKLFGTERMLERLSEQQKRERGALFSFVEFLIIIYVQGFIWAEIKALWKEGLNEYLEDLWNIIDFISNVLYVNWSLLRLTAWYQTLRELRAGLDPYQPRENWHPFDPMLIAEGMFGAANIFSFLKLVHIFSVHPHLGPLQIALGRMVFDILKFFFIYTLVLFAFGCGINQLLWYYADMDKKKCYSLPNGRKNPNEELSCDVWRRFSNLFETSQSLFWASFGLVDLFNFELTGVKSFTRFWSLLMFGSYNVINVIVLLNLLIAMMSNSYSTIIEKCDMEWKFARSKLWMSYFEGNDDVPPPFNLIPCPSKVFGKRKRERHSVRRKQTELREIQYQKVICNLVKRFVTKEQRKHEESLVTEDDVNEVKQDISSFKYELLNIFKINGIETGDKHQKEDVILGKKHQARERRLKKGFNIGLVEGIDLRNIFVQKKKDMDFAEIVLKALLKGEKIDWNTSVLKFASVDHIGSSAASIRRQSLRYKKRKSPWNRIQFYHRRGVFLGGEINLNILKESQTKMKRELRRPPIGWRKLQKLADKGLIKEIVDNNDGEDISQAVSSFQPETTSIIQNNDPSSGSSSTSASPNSSGSPSLTPKPSPLQWQKSLSPNVLTTSEGQSASLREHDESKTDDLNDREASSVPEHQQGNFMINSEKSDDKNIVKIEATGESKEKPTTSTKPVPDEKSSPTKKPLEIQPKPGWL